MTMCTPQELEKHNYQRFSWNNGAIVEYWKSIGKTPDDFNNRIGVRFGEWKSIPFIVWLFFSPSAYPLRHLTTIEQVEQLYTLLSGNTPKERTDT